MHIDHVSCPVFHFLHALPYGVKPRPCGHLFGYPCSTRYRHYNIYYCIRYPFYISSLPPDYWRGPVTRTRLARLETSTYSNTQCLATCMIYITILDATRMRRIASEEQVQGSTHRRRPKVVNRHIAPHRRPPSSAPAQRCGYIHRLFCTATFIILFVSEGQAKARRVGASHKACAGI